MSEVVATALITAILGGGMFTGIAALLKAVAERRQNKAAAAKAGATAPVEAESVSVATITKVMEGISKDNERLRADIKTLDTRVEESEQRRKEDSEHLHHELSELRRALRAAHDYIEDFIAWGKRVAPDEPQPDPPADYRRL